MKTVIKNLPLRSAELPEQTSGIQNLEAWQGMVYKPAGSMALVGYVFGGFLFLIGFLLFVLNR